MHIQEVVGSLEPVIAVSLITHFTSFTFVASIAARATIFIVVSAFTALIAMCLHVGENAVWLLGRTRRTKLTSVKPCSDFSQELVFRQCQRRSGLGTCANPLKPQILQGFQHGNFREPQPFYRHVCIDPPPLSLNCVCTFA